MTIEKIERIAFDDGEMPTNLNTAEQLLFQKVRYLYAMYRLGKVSRERGNKEKIKILEQFKADSLSQRIYEQHLRIYNSTGSMLADANKSDCERCKRFAGILDGREKI